jgi:hypothetical protein
MTGLLATISGYFTKAILLGTLLPVAVFVTSFFIVILPLLPGDVQFLLPLVALDPQWKLLAVTLATVLLSGLLYSLNIPVTKLYEGYTWINTSIGRRRKRHYQAIYETADKRIKGMRTLVRTTRNAKDDNARISAVLGELQKVGVDSVAEKNWQELSDDVKDNWDKLQRDTFTSFPTKTGLILPTTLGNIIRSFEYYPDREYGMDAIATWSRLIAKIDTAYAATIDEAKTSFDFMLNLSFLSAVSLFIQIVAGLVYGKPFASAEDLSSWLLRLAITAFLAWGFYHLSFSRAAAWGETIKGAFDLYRNDLLTQLGFNQKPATRNQERVLWDNISLQMIYSDHPDEGPLVPRYADEPSFVVQTDPADVGLSITSGIEESWSKRKLTVVIVIKNVDEKNRTADTVIITDTLKDDFQYRWDSATLNGEDVAVEGRNPYRFMIEKLAAGHEAQLKYKVVRLP